VSPVKISAEDYDALSKKVAELQREKDELTKELARIRDQRESVAMNAKNQEAGANANF
jgi:hypothetical protein